MKLITSTISTIEQFPKNPRLRLPHVVMSSWNAEGDLFTGLRIDLTLFPGQRQLDSMADPIAERGQDWRRGFFENCSIVEIVDRDHFIERLLFF